MSGAKWIPSDHFWIPVTFSHTGEDYAEIEIRFGLRIKRWSREKTNDLLVRSGTADKTPEETIAIGEEVLGAIADWCGIDGAPDYSRAALDEFMNAYVNAAEAITFHVVRAQQGARQKNSEWLSALLIRATAETPTTLTESSALPTSKPAPLSD